MKGIEVRQQENSLEKVQQKEQQDMLLRFQMALNAPSHLSRVIKYGPFVLLLGVILYFCL